MPKWITTKRDRDSAKYKALHRQLKAELYDLRKPEPSKIDRHRIKSLGYLTHGGE